MDTKYGKRTTQDLFDAGEARIAIRTPDGQIHIGRGIEHHDEMRRRIPNADVRDYIVPSGKDASYFVRTRHDGLVYNGEFFAPIDLEGLSGGLLEAFALRQSNISQISG